MTHKISKNKIPKVSKNTPTHLVLRFRGEINFPGDAQIVGNTSTRTQKEFL